MRRTVFLAILLAGLLFPAVAHADGVIIDPPCDRPGGCPTPIPCVGPVPCPPPHPIFPLAIQYHRVTVDIENQVATTRVDQFFRNDNDFVVEGTYIFPIPAGAAVSRFAMWVDGKRLEGEVLSAEEARGIYDEIVRQTRDPALLEYAGLGAVQASIFPIPPGETRRVELEYSQVLPMEGGLVHYRYPLNTEKFSTEPLEQVSISVNVASPAPVKAVYSPTHDIAVSRDGDFRFSAGYEANDVLPDSDFDLFYSVAAEAIGLNLLTYRDPSAGPAGDGYFVLLAAPSLEVDAAEVVAKDVIVVLDQSGSMDGEKFRQAQDALEYVLSHLNAEDRFNVVAFSTGTRQYAGALRPAADAPEASRWVDSLSAEGGTDIHRALLEALGMTGERPTILIFLTDGLATEGVTDTTQILAGVSRAAPDNVRLFAFGVGDDVDTILLDTLVEQHHGASSYVRPGERIDEAVSGFYAKVSTPVLSDITLDFGGIATSDVYPSPLPDLFAGSQLVLVGRYRDTGPATVTLSGTVNGRRQSIEYADQTFRASGGDEFIPRLWATRKIGHLLNQIRLHGENKELVDQIVTLSIRYGIVTPYTSYLVTEQDVLTEAGRDAIASDQYAQMAQATPAPSYGAEAVEKSQSQSGLQSAEAPAALEGEAADLVRRVGSRTFLFSDGVWIDTAFDPSAMSATPVGFAGEDYFSLLAARPELGPAFALGPRVIAFDHTGTAYEVTGDAPPVRLPPTYTPEPGTTAVPPAGPAGPATTVPSAAGAADGGPFPWPVALLALLLLAVPILSWTSSNRRPRG